MKKVSYFLVAALLVAASYVFVGCSDDNAAPTITVNLGGTDQNSIEVDNDAVVKVKIDFEAEGGIDQIEIEKINSDGAGGNVQGFPKKDGFDSKTKHQVKLDDVTAPSTEACQVQFNVKITDKSKTPQVTSQIVTIKFRKGGVVTNDTFTLSSEYEMGGTASTTLGSFFSVANKNVMKVAEAAAASASVDFMYFYGSTNKATICAPADADAVTMIASIANWSTRNSTKFTAVISNASISSDAEIATWWNANINNATSTKVNNLAVGNVVVFATAGGTKGAFVVTAVGTANTGSIKIKLISKN